MRWFEEINWMAIIAALLVVATLVVAFGFDAEIEHVLALGLAAVAWSVLTPRE